MKTRFNKKNAILVISISGVLFLMLSAYAKFFWDKDNIPEYDISGTAESVASQNKEDAKQPGAAFAGLAGEADSNKKIECDYEVIDEETSEKLEAKIYVEGEKYKSITWQNGNKAYSVFDGNAFYNWSDQSENGFVMANSCVDDFREVTSNVESDGDADLDTFRTSSELLDGKAAANCKEIQIVDLSVPDNVNFIDQCELLKQQKNSIEQLNK